MCAVSSFGHFLLLLLLLLLALRRSSFFSSILIAYLFQIEFTCTSAHSYVLIRALSAFFSSTIDHQQLHDSIQPHLIKYVTLLIVTHLVYTLGVMIRIKSKNECLYLCMPLLCTNSAVLKKEAHISQD